ncbi:MAG TPA: hypothetical protein VLQ93_23525 [Myxococcaceae bacterium]|nr:hypothetical protein [Myxococcaceae bacterium]
MKRQGINELLERLLGLENLSVCGASLRPDGLVVQVHPSQYAMQCGVCGDICSGYDRRPERRWRHLALEHTPIWLSYAPRRVKCASHGVRVQRVPWATHASRVTTELEQMTRWLSRSLGRPAISRMLGISRYSVGTLLQRDVVPLPDRKRIEERYLIGADGLSHRLHPQHLSRVKERLEARVHAEAPQRTRLVEEPGRTAFA